MSYLLLVEKEIEAVKLIIKIRQSELCEKRNILSEIKFKIPTGGFFCLSDVELEEHLQNLNSELNRIIKKVNINEVYGC